MKFLFITTNNLSTNPRLRKEIYHAASRNDSIHLVAFKLDNWSDRFDREIVSNLKMESTCLSATRHPYPSWFRATLVNLVCKILWPFFKKNIKITAFAHHKRSYQLIQALKRIRHPADRVISHNLGALYPAWWFARKHGLPFNFDVEDYYPGEKMNNPQSAEKARRLYLMRELMPDASHVTYAAPLIGQKVQEEIPLHRERFILINNTFPEAEFIRENRTETHSKIQLIWFSQKIGYHRGLEPLIRALSHWSEKFSLTLAGWMDPVFYREHIAEHEAFITCLDPLPQQELHRRLSNYDVGLAVENAASDLNRDICLTNKIWAYYLSGLYILASDTSAQLEFMTQRKDHGMTFNPDTLDGSLLFIQQEIETIRVRSKERQRRALKESYEAEIPRLEATWRN